MDKQPAVSDLERRKQVKVLLRQDLSITRQKYEGRTYYVVKDPVTLRYFRFKEQERFLLDFLDGRHTLEEAQKAFEQRFRPDRLTLEDLEAFTSQLLQAGLAQNESPGAGKQLYDRYKKRRRSKAAQTYLNILYIKIPLFDPDRLLERMLPKLRFIFTYWFLAASIGIMLAAGLLVATHFQTFWNRLPTAQQFFTVHNLIYLWAALGLVKVIHEFGHGLSCKAFGGEVHEMGLLFLVLSPCLFCNVSDAWTLPNKWKRILISGAGIYVELIIASLATFVWWWTDDGTFVNHLAMSLMVVCSISTVIFNANPLMRFDGYYILADWLEIPNLRDRSNKYLKRLVMEYLLGMEVQPEPYMALSRRILFVFYAIASYLYRWLITFSILYFMYTFLKPYKLGALSFLLGTGAVATMVGWPAYRLGKSLHRRGRIPDMKMGRVWLLAAAIALVIIGIVTVPLPMSVRGMGLIQMDPTAVRKVIVPESGGFLVRLAVEDGQSVQKGDIVAVLENPELEIRLKLNLEEQKLRREQLAALARSAASAGVAADRIRLDTAQAEDELNRLRAEERDLREQFDRLTLRAPRAGTVVRLVREEMIGKLLEGGTLLCEVGDATRLHALMLLETHERQLVKAGAEASILIHGRGYRYWPGTVAEIAAKEAQEVPPELSSRTGGEVVTKPDPELKIEKPRQQYYLVAVRFESIDRAVQPGVICLVKIEAEPRTIWWRFRRWLAQAFSIGL